MGGSQGKQVWQPVVLPAQHTAIVTGANTGLGYEIAKHLALMGARVILACKSEPRAQAAMLRIKADLLEYSAADEPPLGYQKENLPQEVNVEYMNLDLASMESVIQFITAFKATGYPLHTLVCNAGIMMVPQGYTEDGFETHFQVNYLGHLLLTLYMIPLMKEHGEESRIINITSLIHSSGKMDLKTIQGKKNYNRKDMYANSKLFQIMNMFSLQRRLTGTNITVNCMHPGAVQTELSRNIQNDSFYKAAFTLGKTFGIIKSDVLMGAAGAINAAVNPTLQGMSGLYFENCYPVTPSQTARNEKAQEVLWRYSLECLKDHLVPQILADLTCDLSELGIE